VSLPYYFEIVYQVNPEKSSGLLVQQALLLKERFDICCGKKIITEKKKLEVLFEQVRYRLSA